MYVNFFNDNAAHPPGYRCAAFIALRAEHGSSCLFDQHIHIRIPYSRVICTSEHQHTACVCERLCMLLPVPAHGIAVSVIV